MKFMRCGANAIIDGQWGSTGKGKLVGLINEQDEYGVDLAICDYMPNAGHTVIRKDGTKFVLCQIPVSAAFGVSCLLGPHAAIDVELFKREWELCGKPSIKIHPHASVITEEHRHMEKLMLAGIASTVKGGAAATIQKIMRQETAKLAKYTPELEPFLADTHEIAQKAERRGDRILIETAQGFDLGLNHGHVWPYVTSRDCALGRAMDNAGLPAQCLKNVFGSLRTFPIRVGNTAEGTSGPWYPDQEELTWESLSALMNQTITPEITTVTKRVRRVFTFSYKQLDRFLGFVCPTHLFLNFANYFDERPDALNALIEGINNHCDGFSVSVDVLGTGAGANDFKEIGR